MYLKSCRLNTPLGQMLAIADEEKLYLLEFVACKKLNRELKLLEQRTKRDIVPGNTSIITALEAELKGYFEGTLQKFTVPLFLEGSSFQHVVWHELQKIPYGHTRSYKDIAIALGNPAACRAVARANSTNHCAIVIPCHRVINSNKQLGGYAAGVERKRSLLAHEARSR